MKKPQGFIDGLNRLCQHDPDGGKGTYFDEEVVFDDGKRMAIQVCACDKDPNDNVAPPAWTQGVLFDPDGNELGCTEVGEYFDGDYCVYLDDVEYCVTVSALGDEE
jgi:hypothetical protein